METSYVVGLVLATAHVILIGRIVWLIYFANEPDWPMYWMLPLILDFPASLLFVAIGRVLRNVQMPNLEAGSAPALSIPNFIMPFIFLGVGGTVWWFFVPQSIAWAWRVFAG